VRETTVGQGVIHDAPTPTTTIPLKDEDPNKHCTKTLDTAPNYPYTVCIGTTV